MIYVATLLPTMLPAMLPLDETANPAAANSTEDVIIHAAARRRQAAFHVFLLCLTVPTAPATLHRRALGKALLEGLEDGAPAMWQRLFRMTKASFEALVDWLRMNTMFKGGRVSEREKLLIFLWIVCQGAPHGTVAHMFGRFDEIISRLV